MIDEQIWQLAGGAGSHRGTGGMWTKIQAAEIATQAGIGMFVVNGATPNLLPRLLAKEPLGTYFHPRTERLEARKRWILAETVKDSALLIDAGATKALQTQGKSLLAAGIQEVRGSFKKGQTIRIFDTAQQELARGLCRYNAEELRQIAGQHSREIESILGYSYGPEVIHRNDMVIIKEEKLP